MTDIKTYIAKRMNFLMRKAGVEFNDNTLDGDVEMVFRRKEEWDAEEFDKALKVHTLIETLEEDEDVAAVWHNAIIPDDIAAQIITHVEKARFRT